MYDLTEKYFKVAIINMFTKLNKTMFKEAKEGILTTLCQKEDIIKEQEIIKNN